MVARNLELAQMSSCACYYVFIYHIHISQGKEKAGITPSTEERQWPKGKSSC